VRTQPPIPRYSTGFAGDFRLFSACIQANAVPLLHLLLFLEGIFFLDYGCCRYIRRLSGAQQFVADLPPTPYEVVKAQLEAQQASTEVSSQLRWSYQLFQNSSVTTGFTG
jgi:hypothetical protein